MEIKITVITPTYNRAHTLSRAFDSLNSQRFKDFKWIIMDDGSTDNTADLVKEFKKQADFQIDYFQNPNQHKFHTVFEGIKKVETPFFTILDSDDSYPENALKILLSEAEKIENPDAYISVIGLSGYENGTVVGDVYPGNGFDGSIFEMRYKYKIKGDKNGIFITKSYQRELSNFDYSHIPKGIYIPQSVFFNTYDAKGLKTRFINQIIRIYHKDEQDQNSVSNTRWFGKNRYGLMLGHLSFLNSYGKTLYNFPKALVRNLVGYQLYALANQKRFVEIQRELKHFKFLSMLLFPIVFVGFKLKIIGS